MAVSAPKTVAEIETFITMLRTACEDKSVYEQLERVLSMPDERRRAFIQHWVNDMLIHRAPTDFIQAIACLLDDSIAEKAYQVIFQCQRAEQEVPSNSASLTDAFLKALRALSGAAKRGR
jgi:hypothetical protein